MSLPEAPLLLDYAWEASFFYYRMDIAFGLGIKPKLPAIRRVYLRLFAKQGELLDRRVF
jgi:hypothetical protein